VTLPRSQQEAEIVDQFVDAFEQGDIDGVVALLTDDAKLTMPPEPFEFIGRPAIADFYRAQGVWRPGIKLIVTRANNQPAIAYYLPDPNANVLRAAGILVLTLSRDRISAIARFGDRSLITCFGLPRTLQCS
jgi:RNA polymerase sigma-70 factor (ECF subfamily)